MFIFAQFGTVHAINPIYLTVSNRKYSIMYA